MNLVLDASAAVELVLGRPQASNIMREVQAAERILVPELFVFEVTNFFWKLNKFQNLQPKLCQEALKSAVNLPDEFVPGLLLHEYSLTLALSLKKPAYDLFYLATAKLMDASLITLDKNLNEICRKLSVHTLAI
jgi:predicted nucleic acid-binding protein